MRSHLLCSLIPALLFAAAPACAPDAGPDERSGHDHASDDHAGHDHAVPAASARAEGVCAPHAVAEARCPFCHPDLVESMGMCAGHGVAEALCWQCTPGLVAGFRAVGDWCAGHDRPESQCVLCNPEPGSPERAVATDAVPADAPRYGRPPAVHCSTSETVVQLASAEIAGLAGLRLEPAARRAVSRTVVCNARLTWDTSRRARLASPVPGIVAAVHRDLGDRVRRGDPLATVTSPELAAAKAAWLETGAVARLWTKNHERQEALLGQGLVAERDVLETATELAESRIARSRAEQELLRLGLTPADLARLAESGRVTPEYVVRAPFDGVVTERAAAVGELADGEHALYAVADPSTLWAILDVYEADIPELAPGQPVVLRIDGLPGTAAAGRITWISEEVDPHTRTLRARAEIPNPDGALKANLFARAEVTVRDRMPAVVVPIEAVQWEGCCNVVFVKGSDVLYEPRKVFLGVRTGTVYEVLRGVSEGEEVVTQGSFLLKTELMKGSIGAGCCEVQPGT